MDESLMRSIITEAKRDPLGFAWGICQCVILLAVAWGMLVVLCACAGPAVAR